MIVLPHVHTNLFGENKEPYSLAAKAMQSAAHVVPAEAVLDAVRQYLTGGARG